jgi:hypothetical protein
MPFNGRTLTKAQTEFLKKSIKQGYSKTKCIEKMVSKFKRGISDRNLSRFARIHKLKFAAVQPKEYTKTELTSLKGLWLVKAGSLRVGPELKTRDYGSYQKKVIDMKRKGDLTEDLRARIKKDIRKGTKATTLAKKYGISVKYIREFKEKDKKSSIEIDNLRRWESVDVNDVLDLVEKAQDKLAKMSAEQGEANIKITTDKDYVALCFISDIHLENVNTNVRQLREDFKIIKKTKDFYVGFGGDLIDNFVVGPHKEGIIEAVIPPKAARIAAGKLFDSLKGKLLWTILGCHDAWDANYADYNLPEHISRKLGVPYLGHGGDVNITLSKRGNKSKNPLYEIHARHKYRGSSGLTNGTACCKNVLRDIGSKYDVVAISHNHFAEIKIEHYLGKERTFIRTGSYKKEDRYSKMLGYQSNEFNSLIPVVIMNTTTKEMRVVSGVKTAADTLKALNRKR